MYCCCEYLYLNLMKLPPHEKFDSFNHRHSAFIQWKWTREHKKERQFHENEYGRNDRIFSWQGFLFD